MLTSLGLVPPILMGKPQLQSKSLLEKKNFFMMSNI
jgi:hypothetical protein